MLLQIQPWFEVGFGIGMGLLGSVFMFMVFLSIIRFVFDYMTPKKKSEFEHLLECQMETIENRRKDRDSRTSMSNGDSK